MSKQPETTNRETQVFIGRLSGRRIIIPEVNAPPMPALASSGVIHNGKKAENFGGIDSSRGYPDMRSFKRKFGLVIPATNTSMEHELWSIIFRNPQPHELQGIGLHTANVITPKAKLEMEEYLHDF